MHSKSKDKVSVFLCQVSLVVGCTTKEKKVSPFDKLCWFDVLYVQCSTYKAEGQKFFTVFSDVGWMFLGCGSRRGEMKLVGMKIISVYGT